MKKKKFLISEVIEYKNEERIRLGMMSSHRWRMDPKVLLFSMARYKFVAKLFSGKKDVLEIGCGDGWGSQIVIKEVGSIHCIDMDPLLIDECKSMVKNDNISFEIMDISESSVYPPKDAAYMLDVLEHVEKEDEENLLINVSKSIELEGVCIIGMPSLESQIYASKPSRKSHVNCKSGDDFKKTLEKYFRNVFLFSMNDEIIHTGFNKMAHYLFGLCVGVK
tara:strand:- start:420 stop:1082 length:663 start_codon:yes stop_codon:yes gene_type:complete